MLPAIGQMITLQVVSADEREADLIFKSRLADADEQRLWIEAPFDDQGLFKRLFKGDARPYPMLHPVRSFISARM